MTGLVAFFNWLQLLGLAILMGGIIVLGVLVAPAVFGMLPSMGMGGELMSTLFVRFNTILATISMGLIGVGYGGKFLLGGFRKRIRYVEGIFLMILLAVGIYVGGILTPRMETLREARIQDPADQQAVEAFGAAHQLSQILFSVNLIAGLVVFSINAVEMARGARRV